MKMYVEKPTKINPDQIHALVLLPQTQEDQNLCWQIVEDFHVLFGKTPGGQVLHVRIPLKPTA